MANALPSRPGDIGTNTAKIQTPIPTGKKRGLDKDGRYVERTELDNGDVMDSYLFQADAPKDVVKLDAAPGNKKVKRPVGAGKGS